MAHVLSIVPKIIEIHGQFGELAEWTNDNAKKAGNIICSANNGLHKKMLKILKPVSS